MASNFSDDKFLICSVTTTVVKDFDAILLNDSPNVKQCMITIDPKDLFGLILLKESDKIGQPCQAHIVCTSIVKL